MFLLSTAQQWVPAASQDSVTVTRIEKTYSSNNYDTSEKQHTKVSQAMLGLYTFSG